MNVPIVVMALLTWTLHAPQEPPEALRVRVVGEGPDVVLLTGLLGSVEGFQDLAHELAARGRRSIIVEPLGVGESARPKHADYSLTAQAQRVVLVLDSLEVSDALVVGHAVSAAIAYRLAAARPDLARAVVALEGGAPARAATASLRQALRWAPLLRIFGGKGQVRRLFARELTEASVDPAWVTDEVIRQYTRGPLRDLGAAIDAYGSMSRAREPVPIDAVLSRLRCPVLVLRGEAGRVPDTEIETIRSRVEAVTVREVARAGVFLHEERPAAVADAIAAFDSPGVASVIPTISTER